MAIPRAVKEAAERAEALHKQLYEQPSAEPQPAPEEPVAAPVDSSLPVAAEPTQQPADAATVEQESASAPPNEQPDEQKKEDPWEHRYKVLEGKYRAEVPRLAADNRDLRTKMDALSAELESLKSKADQPNSTLISQEDREKYGDDLLDVIKRAAQEQVAAKDQEIAALKSRLESIHSDTAKNAEVSFYDRLSQLTPDWVTVNDDPGFLKWLDEYDGLTGKRRQDLLSDAENSRDADRVSRFFNAWKSQQKTTTASTNKALEAQVVPETNKVVTPPKAKRFFTRAEIADFYSRARRGEVSNADMVAVESEIHAATLEGRVI